MMIRMCILYSVIPSLVLTISSFILSFISVYSHFPFSSLHPSNVPGLSSQGSVFLDGPKTNLELILPLGELVVVASKCSVIHVFDAQSAKELQRVDVNFISKHVGERIIILPTKYFFLPFFLRY